MSTIGGIVGGAIYKNISDNDLSVCIDKTNFIVGDKVIYVLKGKMLSWTIFRKKNKNPNLNSIKYIVSKIFNYTFTSDSFGALLLDLEEVLNIPEKMMYNRLLSEMFIHDILSLSLYRLFNNIVNLIENLIISFNKALSNIGVNSNNITDLMNNWNVINERNNIQSSSLLILMSNPSFKLPLNNEDKLKKFIWDITTSAKCTPEILKYYTAFITKFAKFVYLGFCPKKPIYRIKELLKFPMNELVLLILHIDPNVALPDYFSMYKGIFNIINSKKKDKIKEIKFKKYKIKKFVNKKKVSTEQFIKLKILHIVEQILMKQESLREQLYNTEMNYIQHTSYINDIVDILKEIPQGV